MFKRMEYPDAGVYRYQEVEVLYKLDEESPEWPAWGKSGDDIYLIRYAEDSGLTKEGETDYAREKELSQEDKGEQPM